MMKKVIYKAMAVSAVILATGATTVYAANTQISLDRAKELAVAKAGVPAASVEYRKAKLDFDDGRYEYEIKFLYNGNKYEVELDANTGSILKYKTEATATNNVSTQISLDRAKELAIAKAGVPAASVRYKKAKLDFDNGRYEYEIEFLYNGYEYEVDVDANTGSILNYDVEYDD